MAIDISDVLRRVVYAPNGTGPYQFTFEVLAQTDIAVYRGSTLLTLTTDYTVSLNVDGTGSVTLVATAGTSNITIVGDRGIARSTDFVTGGDLLATSLNDELDAQISQVAATEADEENPETTEAEQPAEEQPQEITVEETTAPVADEVTAAAVVHAAAPVAYTKPRSPIKTQAHFLEHSIKAQRGNHESAEWIAHAKAEDAKHLTAADDSFTTNPAFKPVQYVSTVVDTQIGARGAIDAIGTRALPNAGMTVSIPKITTSGSVAETAEGAGPSETGIVSAYVDATVKAYKGLQRYSVELFDRADPSFYAAMLDNMRRVYAQATEAAVIAELTASGTQATATAADVDGIVSFVKTETPAAYLATGELATRYIAGTSQWGLLIGAQDSTKRPIFSASQPMNAAGDVGTQSLRGNVMGLDLYVSNKAVSTSIDESAFIVVPSSVAIYESPVLQLSTNVVTTGEIETMLYGYLATKVIVAGGVRRFNLT